jgi:Tol biopolymer transport system component
MPLAAGVRLGPYEILAPIGAGGMGEVYRARDTRLGREVAVKVLPASFVSDPERLRRFEQEARAASALNHPNILTVHDFGTHQEAPYLVSELLVGQSLRQRLGEGAIAQRKAIEIALQIARGLAAAHDRGIVHRDLKPENVFLCRDGRVKILDFGLAKLQAASLSASEMGNAQTLTRNTDPGVVLGTAGYMSPEQVRGQPADARSDLFAFGAILYEMLSGRRAFPGATAADVMTAILTHEPPQLATALPPVSPALERLVRHCLEKQPEERARSAHDLAFDLESLVAASTLSGATPARAGERRLVRWLWTAPVLAAVFALGWALGHGASRNAVTAMRLAIAPPAEAPLALGNDLAIAISPDGSRLVYTGSSRLFVRPLDGFEAKPLAGTEHAQSPFFSPDGAWVGFFADGKLKKVALAGGPAIDLCDAPIGRGGSWGSDGTIIFAPTDGSGLARVDGGGGVPRTLTTPDPKQGEASDRWPQILPGNDAVLFTVSLGGKHDHDKIAVQSLRTGQRRVLVEGSSYARYLPSGHLVFNRGYSLAAAPMDVARLELTGSPVSVLDGVQVLLFKSGVGEFAISAAGTLVYLPVLAPSRSVVSTSRAGVSQTLPLPPRGYNFLALSPDGGRLALSIEDGPKMDLWVYDLGRGSLQRLTSEGELTPMGYLAWTPDGRRIAFSASEKGRPFAVFWQLADASAPPERLTTAGSGDLFETPLSWLPDGRSLLYGAPLIPTGAALRLLPLAGDGKPQALGQMRHIPWNPAFSPDGRWMAYDWDESGQSEVYVQPYPGFAEKWQVSIGGGKLSHWTRDGRELVYATSDGKVMVVTVADQPRFHAGTPTVLFEAKSGTLADVTPDGQRFFFIRPGDAESAPPHLNVILGWFDELERRVPHGAR